ncbi:serine/threonine-protein kinase [Cohnella lubricantis]
MYRSEPGSLLANRYRLLGPIGQGGMGSVHLAEDVRLGGKLRAVKLTKPLPEDRDAFIAEARLLGRLQHPHLPQIVDYFPPDREGTACIVMDYIAGETVGSRWMQLGCAMPFAMWLRYMLQLCDALRYLHAQEPPVVFRDLKPGNVLIDPKDRAILVDFGIARLYRPDALADTMKLGTPGFAAPEQLRGEQSDARTDLYGLGALAYFLLSGGEFAYRRSGGLTKLGKDVPPLFAELLERLLSERPDGRPAGAAELYEELCAFAARHPSEARIEIEADRGLDEASQPGGARTIKRTSSNRPEVIAFLSAYPGAGASFIASLISGRLGQLEAPHALVECPGGDGELYYAMDGENEMPSRAVFADPAGERPATPAWRRGSASIYPLDPNAAGLRAPERAFADWLRRLGPRIVLLDVSSRWETPGVAEWVAQNADRIYIAADCLPTKWSARRQRAAARMQEEARIRTIPFGWIANRDHEFAHRADWLASFPRKPLLGIPLMPAAAVVRAVWQGDHYPSDDRLSARLDRFIQAEWVRA